MNPTKVFEKNLVAFNSGVRRIINKGGTSSSKTYSILELLFLIAKKRSDKGVLISILSESLPHLKKGAIRDFEIILKRENCYDENNIDFSNYSYHFGNSVIEFFSADSGKATGLRRDIIYYNECNNIPYKVIEEADIRTKETIFYDYNPTAQFWMEDKVMSLPQNEWVLIKSNHLDNKHLQETIRHEIELKASIDPNFKRIHVDVEYGNYEGLIFNSPTIIKEFPKESKWILYGMDFGYTNDPTTLIKIGFSNGELFFDELLYKTGLTNIDIANELKKNHVDNSYIIADSAEPKSIEELRRMGYNIRGAAKGKDSILNGIDLMKRYKQNVTENSLNLIKEFRNYQWRVDKTTGKHINDPGDTWNHGLDAIRYVAIHKLSKPANVGIEWGS